MKEKCLKNKTRYGVSSALTVLFGWMIIQRSRHKRVWEVGQEELPHIKITNSDVEIENFRDFIWKKNTEPKIEYKSIKFKLQDLISTDVIISHFDKFEGLAHIFLSFGLQDGRHITISVETRRKKGEEFSPWLGLMRRFEIIYVIASEKDIIGLRTDVREGERVYLYPTIATPEKSQELFLNLSQEINSIHRQPKIYNTLTHNCINEITRRVEEISTLKFPLTWKTILPGFFDEILYEMKIIPTDKSFAEIKRGHFVDNNNVNYLSEDYSRQLRINWK